MVGFDIKQLFFDSSSVTSKVSDATRRVFSKFGAYVRQTAKQSIRKRKRPSPPGTPPSSHTGLLKKFIFFGYEPTQRSVVIGPMRLTERKRGAAPALLEYGGQTTLARRGKRRRVNYRARPFMGPAFIKEQTKLPAMWQGSIR